MRESRIDHEPGPGPWPGRTSVLWWPDKAIPPGSWLHQDCPYLTSLLLLGNKIVSSSNNSSFCHCKCNIEPFWKYINPQKLPDSWPSDCFTELSKPSCNHKSQAQCLVPSEVSTKSVTDLSKIFICLPLLLQVSMKRRMTMLEHFHVRRKQIVPIFANNRSFLLSIVHRISCHLAFLLLQPSKLTGNISSVFTSLF